MKKRIFFLFFLIFLIFFIFTTEVQAAFLKFDKENLEVSTGETFQVQVIVDSEGEEIVSTDAYISYDEQRLEVVSVEAGDFFDTVSYDILEGRLYIAGITEDIGIGKTGSGLLATVTFKAKTSGEFTLAYICDPNDAQSSKIIKVGVDAENIINCSSNGSLSLKITGSSQPTAETSGGSTVSKSATPNQLPKAGIFDNTLNLVLWGGGLLTVGFLLKVLFL